MSCVGSASGVGNHMSAPVHTCSHTIKSWAGGLWDISQTSSSCNAWEVEKLQPVNQAKYKAFDF